MKAIASLVFHMMLFPFNGMVSILNQLNYYNPNASSNPENVLAMVSAIKLAKDPVLHQHSKHIELHIHFIRNLVHDHVLEVLYFPTNDQVADIFTKVLTEAKFSKL